MLASCTRHSVGAGTGFHESDPLNESICLCDEGFLACLIDELALIIEFVKVVGANLDLWCEHDQGIKIDEDLAEIILCASAACVTGRHREDGNWLLVENARLNARDPI